MQEKVYKYRIKLTKYGELKFISHLDWQNLIIKTFRRCGLRLVLSEGFNKIPKTGFSPALPIFIESECELVYFQTYEPVGQNFKELFEKNTNKNIKLLELKDYSDLPVKLPPLDTLIQWAKYEARPILYKNESIFNLNDLMYTLKRSLASSLSSDEVLITKKTKKGLNKVINYRKSLHCAEIKDGMIDFVLKAGQDPDLPALRADEFLKTVFGPDVLFEIKRVCFFDKDLKVL